MKKIFLSIFCLVLFIFSNALSQEKRESNNVDTIVRQSTEQFKWPSAYQIEIKKTFTNPNTRIETTQVSPYTYYVDGMRARNEVPTNSGLEITIFRIDQGKMYSFNSKTKVYHESKYSSTKISDPFDCSGTWTFQNEEVLSGSVCKKYTVVPLQNTDHANESFIVWLNSTPVFPVRVQYSDGIAQCFSNYVPGPIPDSKFEIPGGYRNWNNIPILRSK